MDRLREHGVILSDGPLRLRPMTEDDWDILLVWNNDPKVLCYAEGGDITSWSLPDMQWLYRGVSQHGYVFMVELDGQPIGECWLQEMNIESVLRRYPGLDLRRIDLMIGEKKLWGKGWGTRIIRLLTRFAFEECGADAIVEPGIGDHNPRSRRAFEKNGFMVDRVVPQPPGSKAKVEYELILTKERYAELAQDGPEEGA
jgi:RimJ/RimL family protein N-acetyltransferase